MYKFEQNKSVNVTDIRETRESEMECVSVHVILCVKGTKRDAFSPQCGTTLETNKRRAKGRKYKQNARSITMSGVDPMIILC
jgi:hypothetical protein